MAQVESAAPVIDFEVLLAPISEEQPSGEAMQYSDVYDSIKKAREADDATNLGEWQCAVDAEGLVETGNEEEQSHFGIGDEVGQRIEQIVARPVASIEVPRRPTDGDIEDATLLIGRHGKAPGIHAAAVLPSSLGAVADAKAGRCGSDVSRSAGSRT